LVYTEHYINFHVGMFCQVRELSC